VEIGERVMRGAWRLVATFLWLVGCVRQPEPSIASTDQTVVLGQSFRLARGKTAEVQGRGVRVRFEEVLDDSRCPARVQCVWAGDASIVLRLAQAGRETSVDTLRLTREPHAVTYRGYIVRLEGLEPARQQDAPPRPEAYVASLMVSEAAAGR
jgi:hypothetical protein